MRRNRGRAMFEGVAPVLGGALVLTTLFAAGNILSGMELLVAVVFPAIVFLPVAIEFMLVGRPTCRRQVRGMLATVAEPQEREELPGLKALSLDAEGLAQRGALGHWHLSWPAITAVEETDDHLFVMPGAEWAVHPEAGRAGRGRGGVDRRDRARDRPLIRRGQAVTGGHGAAASALTVTLAREDPVVLNLDLAERPQLWRKRGALALVLSAVGILAPRAGVLAAWPIPAGLAVVATLWLVSLPALARWSPRRQFRFWYAQPGTLLTGRRDIDARAEGLFVRAEQSESRFARSGITAIVETPAHLFPIAEETNAHLIP